MPSLLLGVVALVLLLRPLGIMGAAVASVAGYSAATLALGVSLRQHDLTFAAIFRPRGADVRYVMDVAALGWDQVQRLRARIV